MRENLTKDVLEGKQQIQHILKNFKVAKEVVTDGCRTKKNHISTRIIAPMAYCTPITYSLSHQTLVEHVLCMSHCEEFSE